MSGDKRPVSKLKLFGYFALAYLAAALILVVAVLPVQFGVNLFGVGEATGLSDVGDRRSNALEAMETDAAGEDALVQGLPLKTETIRLEIEDLGEVEYKFILPEKGAFVYSWHVEGETPNQGVYYDFHGHPDAQSRDQFPERFFKRYEEGENPTQSGSFVAPFRGYHGWFFLNLEARPITVVIEISGFYESHIELYRSVAGEVITAVQY